MTNDKYKTVAFTGHRSARMAAHRPDERTLFLDVAFDTFVAVCDLCRQGYDTFLTGMAEGFDLIAAEEVLRAKMTYPHIRLVAVVPFRCQSARYGERDKAKYDNILRMSDEVVTLSEAYFMGCFHRRNDYLLEHSTRLLTYYDYSPAGGTAYTVRHAIARKMGVTNIFRS